MKPYINNFSIRVFKLPIDAPLFSSRLGSTLLEIKSDKSLFNPNASVILADPFLFVWKNKLYLFYEHLNKWYGKGRICVRYTEDLETWSDEIDVLVEPFHLSFPFVFEDNGLVYMIPETGENHAVSLYQSEDDSLTKWSLVSKLLEEKTPWYDSSIIKKDGFYFLFTGRDNNVNQSQHLFYSDNLMGPYKEHPKSPIYEGRDGGRNAGSILLDSDSLYRPVQMCLNSYGSQVSIMKIETITPINYKECLFKRNILEDTKPPYTFGGHQWNSVLFQGNRIIATDYRERNYNIIELFRRIKKKLNK